MHRKTVIVFIGFVLMTSLCWAVNPFQQFLSDVRDQTGMVRMKSQEIEKLVNRVQRLAVEIDDLSNGIVHKDQKEKMKQLEIKADRFRDWVVDLSLKTDALKDLAAKLQDQSRMLYGPLHPKNKPGKCGPGKVWIPGQKSPSGKWVPGHCASSY